MKKYVYILSATALLLSAATAVAQLPANPWASNSKRVQVVNKNINKHGFRDKGTIKKDSSNNNAVIAVDPWANTKDTNNTQTWRGSGQFGRLNYTGDATTYREAYGQEMIAPEVNRHNMLTFTQHLRNLGYKIPAGYDQKIKNFPQEYKRKLQEAYSSIGRQNNPLDTMFSGVLDVVEDGSGLDIENILFNTMDLLSTD